MKRFIFSAVLAVMFLFVMPLNALNADAAYNYAKGYDGDMEKIGLYDEYGLFGGDEFEEIDTMIDTYAELLEMNIAVFLADSSYAYFSDYQTEIFADDSYDEIFGEDTDGVFYYLDLSGKRPAYDYLSTSGKSVLYYQDKIDSREFERTMISHLPSSGEEIRAEQIHDAITAFCDFLMNRKNESTSFSRHYKDSSSGKVFYYKNGELFITRGNAPSTVLFITFIFFLIGLVTSLITKACVKSHYKFKASANPGTYVSQQNSRLNIRTDTFLRTHTSRAKIESSSGGRSGGGGGHSHGGGHGGGGYHR
ncbi:MAG: hypothetical protein IJ666_04790 [Ruminococcus sp.]|nr:hypothetical protein [Ruminococcus sp.]